MVIGDDMVDGSNGHGLRFLIPEDAASHADGLPAAEPAESALSTSQLLDRLRPAANDGLLGLLVIGFDPGAAALIAGDVWLAQKQVIWVVRPGQLRALDASLSGRSELRVVVAPCADPERLPFILEHLPLCWSLALIEPQWLSLQRIVDIAGYRFLRRFSSPDRHVSDLGHALARLPTLPEATPLGHWRGQGVGRTALCVAAGPSLDRRMDFLAAHQGDCLVIAVDVVAERLQKQGIRVDFVLNVDSDEIIRERLTANHDPATVLVMPVLGHRCLDALFARRTYFGGGAVSRWLLPPDSSFSTGTSVGIASVGFAHLLGCREVVLLGHDLAYGERYYSQSVVDSQKWSSFEADHFAALATTVPGNGGMPVPSNRLFQVAIHDLGMMLELRPELTVYNPNIADGIGAAIAHTVAFPAGWRPAGDGPVQRLAPAPAGGSARTAAALLRRLSDDAAALAGRWREQIGSGRNLVQAAMIVDAGSDSLAAAYLEPFTTVAERWQLHALARPDSMLAVSVHRDLQQRFARLLTAGERFLAGLPALLGQPSASAPANPDRDRVLRFLGPGLPPLIENRGDAADLVLLPGLGRASLHALAVAPEEGLPPPLSANDGLLVASMLKDAAPLALLRQSLCLAALEDAAHWQPMLEWARTCGVLAPDEPQIAGADAEPFLAATAIVLRLAAGGGSPRADARRATAWHPCHPHLMRALCRRADAATTVAELITTGALPLDDRLGAILLLHFADFRSACRLLVPSMSGLGEATALAMAQRELDAGNHRAALIQSASVRPLSRLRDHALAITAECRLVQGDRVAAAAAVVGLVDRELAEHWRHRLDCASGDWRASLRRACAGDRLPEAARLAELAKAAAHERDLAALACLGDCLARHAAMHDAGHAALARSVAALSQRLAGAARVG